MFRTKCSTLSFLIVTISFLNSITCQSMCLNPNAKYGTCIALKECPALYSFLVDAELTDEETEFLTLSKCGNRTDDFYVCCTDDAKFVQIPGYKEDELFPRPPFCGQTVATKRIFGGEPSLLFSLPWLALLGYEDRNKQIVFGCGGSLINKRYVLTAAHCVADWTASDTGTLKVIRLGEYDLGSETDCSPNLGCADRPLDVGYENIIIHERFRESNLRRIVADIALIRLNRNIPYTRSIRPICLKSTLNQEDAPPGQRLRIAGWGKTEFGAISNISLEAFISVVPRNECVEKYRTISKVISNDLVCAGGTGIEDTCRGDSGGPLEYNKALEGIVSHGHGCGRPGWPGLYTKVSDYDQWIRDNVKP